MEEHTPQQQDDQTDTSTAAHKTTGGGGNIKWIAGAIIIAGALVALAIILSGSTGTNNGEEPQEPEFQLDEVSYTPGDPDEHIRGATDPSITIIEYSDFECPFCQRFHGTMKQAIADYPNEVQWVYRHLPLPSLHENAIGAAIASECVADLGGNETFWQFADQLFDNQEQIGPDFYETVVADMDISNEAFASCVAENDDTAVREDAEEASAAGGRGTPFSVIIGPDGERTAFPGAQPYERLQSEIESRLAE